MAFRTSTSSSLAELADWARYVRPLVRLGRVVVTEDGPTWELNASETDPKARRFRPDDAERALRAWVHATRPPILHDHQLPSAGDPRVVHGYVVDVLRVSAEDARAKGLRQSGDWLYAELACAPELANLLERGLVGRTSPGLASNYRDDEGRVWPIVLRELSFTPSPRQRTQAMPEEIDRADLSEEVEMGAKAGKGLGAATLMRTLRRHGEACVLSDHAGKELGRGVKEVARLSDELEPGEVVVVSNAEGKALATATIEELVEVAEDLEAAAGEENTDADTLTDAFDVEALTARVAALEESVARIVDRMGSADLSGEPGKNASQTEMSDRRSNEARRAVSQTETLRHEIEKLKAQNRRLEVERAVGGRVLGAWTVEDLVELSDRAPRQYQKVVDSMPRQVMLATERANLNDQSSAPVDERTRAHQLVREKGLTFEDALLQVRRRA